MCFYAFIYYLTEVTPSYASGILKLPGTWLKCVQSNYFLNISNSFTII